MSQARLGTGSSAQGSIQLRIRIRMNKIYWICITQIVSLEQTALQVPHTD